MICPTCGYLVPEGERTCPHCGNLVELEPQAAPTPPKAGAQKAAPARPKRAGSPAPRPQHTQRPQHPQRPQHQKRLDGRQVAVIVSGVVLAAAVAAVVVLLGFRNTRQRDDELLGRQSPAVQQSQAPMPSVSAPSPSPMAEPSVHPSATGQLSQAMTPEDFRQEVIADFQRSCRIYHQWVQGREGSKVRVSQADGESGAQIADGASYFTLLSSAFSYRYVTDRMAAMGATRTDGSLLLPQQVGSVPDPLANQMAYEVTRITSVQCKLRVSWTDGDGISRAYYLDGSKGSEHWVFDDLPTEVGEGQRGFFGSYNAPAPAVPSHAAVPMPTVSVAPTPAPTAVTPTPVTSPSPQPTATPPEPAPTAISSPAPTPSPPNSGNITVVAEKYIRCPGDSIALRSRPVEEERNVILEIPRNESVGFIENTDSVYAKIEYRGQYGYVMREYLADAPEVSPTPSQAPSPRPSLIVVPSPSAQPSPSPSAVPEKPVRYQMETLTIRGGDGTDFGTLELPQFQGDQYDTDPQQRALVDAMNQAAEDLRDQVLSQLETLDSLQSVRAKTIVIEEEDCTTILMEQTLDLGQPELQVRYSSVILYTETGEIIDPLELFGCTRQELEEALGGPWQAAAVRTQGVEFYVETDQGLERKLITWQGETTEDVPSPSPSAGERPAEEPSAVFRE